MKILFIILFCSVGVFAQNYSSCLPKEFKETDVVSTKMVGKNIEKTTIRQSLQKLKAKCSKGKLVDAKKREIKFYQLQGCWGNPPQDYLEIMENQRKEVAELKKKYTVIEITCNSSGYPIP
jgi:preprotein translocase subunit SecF